MMSNRPDRWRACVLAVFAVTWTATGMARAQVAEIRAPDPLAASLEAVSLAELTALLATLDMRGAAGRAENGDPLMRVRTDSGGRFVIALRACPQAENAPCPHFELFAVFPGDGANGSLEAVNLFNRQAAGVKAFRLENGTNVLTRYVTLNHGIARGNVLGNIEGFRRSAESFRTFLTGPPAIVAESAAQVAVSNAASSIEAPGDPSYVPDSVPWADLVNDVEGDGFVGKAP